MFKGVDRDGGLVEHRDEKVLLHRFEVGFLKAKFMVFGDNQGILLHFDSILVVIF